MGGVHGKRSRAQFSCIAQYLLILAGRSVEEEGEVAVPLSLLVAVPLSLLVAVPLSLLVAVPLSLLVLDLSVDTNFV